MTTRWIVACLWIPLASLVFGVSPVRDPSDPEKLLKEKISWANDIVDICIFEQTWTAPTPAYPKGIFSKRAVVTAVHKGKLRIGTEIRFEEAPPSGLSEIPGFSSTVRGELRSFFFWSPTSSGENGRLSFGPAAYWSFSRTSDPMAEVFSSITQTTPDLIRSKVRRVSAPAAE